MTQVIFPVGRMVGGDLYTLEPVVDKHGVQKINKAGQPSFSCSVGVAIKKGAEAHWAETAWGTEIHSIGKAGYPQEHASPFFAWKIKDGDSLVPNKKGRVARDNENYRGHWIVWFSQSWLPALFARVATGKLRELGLTEKVRLGDYLQVQGDIKDNRPSESPGVYLNPSAVLFVGEGERIASEVDVSALESAPAAALPPGARPLTPAVAGFGAPAAVAPPVVVPNPAFLQVPPPAPRPPAVPAARVMTPAAQGATYAQMIEAGWTEELLVQHGMVA